MKKLQNNFTTPEQPKRLLRLGVPEESADCCYDYYADGTIVNDEELDIIPLDDYRKTWKYDIPCWSTELYVGCKSLKSPKDARNDKAM